MTATPLPLIKGRTLYAILRDDDMLLLIVRADSLSAALDEGVAHPALRGEQLHAELATTDHADRWRNGESLYHEPHHAAKHTARDLTTQLKEQLGLTFPSASASEGATYSGRYYVHLTMSATEARALATWMETHR